MPPNPPWGGMGRPDMILGSGQQLCDPRYKWPQATQHYLQDVPVFVAGYVLSAVGPDDRPQGAGEVLRQVLHGGAARLRPLLREGDGQEDGLGQARRHRRSDGPDLEHVYRDLRAAQGNALPDGHGRRHEHDGPHLVHARHAGVLRLLQRPSRRADAENREKRGRSRGREVQAALGRRPAFLVRPGRLPVFQQQGRGLPR